MSDTIDNSKSITTFIFQEGKRNRFIKMETLYQHITWSLIRNGNNSLELQFEHNDRQLQLIKNIIHMNWNDLNHPFPFFYPFCNYPLALQIQKRPQYQKQTIILSNQANSRENIESLKSFDTQQSFIIQKAQVKDPVEVKRKLNRKNRILKKRERQDKFETKKQKKDRNLPSNIFKYFISYLYNHPNTKMMQTSTCNNSFHNLNIQIFINKIKEEIKQTQSYIRQASIQRMCKQQILDKNESLFFRILLKKFLLFGFPLMISQMQKYKRRQKKQLMQLARALFQQIRVKICQ